MTRVAALGFPLDTPSPFLFAVFHTDAYPRGNATNMHAPRIGDGNDFSPSLPYRMYHGTTIPGFPSHPHRGFETLTVTLEGLVDHADSMGSSGRYGNGDCQWMSAGSGVVHQVRTTRRVRRQVRVSAVAHSAVHPAPRRSSSRSSTWTSQTPSASTSCG